MPQIGDSQALYNFVTLDKQWTLATINTSAVEQSKSSLSNSPGLTSESSIVDACSYLKREVEERGLNEKAGGWLKNV
jgi:hypothetical protein